MATDWTAAVAKIRALVQVYLDALAKGPLTAHQAASLTIDLKTLDTDLAGLAASLAPAAPTPAPTGLTNWGAAQIDAGFVFQASLGNTVGADTNPAPGAAKALGFSGVVGTSTATGYIYGIFRDGVLTGTVDAPPATGWDFTFGLAAGVASDAPYVKP